MKNDKNKIQQCPLCCCCHIVAGSLVMTLRAERVIFLYRSLIIFDDVLDHYVFDVLFG